ncbi:hypothetical protein DL771_009547 [Monosporascus sp. 5C6A]|nr:hypothetical protein DL771_009547 [Monosporascus sp. 5C6A]
MHWKSSFAYAVALLGLAPTAEAANSVVFRDAQSGFTFTSYDAAYQIGRYISYRVAIPANAVPGQPYDAVLQVVAPVDVGWAGFAWGGGMTRNPLAVNWASGSTPVVSSRWATSHSMPSAYSGATYQILSKASSVNGTHWKVTARCKGCTSWTGSSGTVVLNPAGETRFAFAASRVKPSGTSPDASITVHSVFATWMHDLNGGKNANFDQLSRRESGASKRPVLLKASSLTTSLLNLSRFRRGLHLHKGYIDALLKLSRVMPSTKSISRSSYRYRPNAVVMSEFHRADTRAQGGGVNNHNWMLAQGLQREGKPVAAGDWSDGIHPNNQGYRKMAQIWWKSILKAADLGFLKEPHEIEDAVGWEKAVGDGVYAEGLTQRGSGLDDGTYHHYGDERDTFLGCFEKLDGHVVYGDWRSSGNEKNRFAKIEDLDPDDDCIPAGIHSVDVNDEWKHTLLEEWIEDKLAYWQPLVKRFEGKGTQDCVFSENVEDEKSGTHGFNTRVWQNKGFGGNEIQGRGETGKWDWAYNSNPAPELRCPEERGVGIFDLPVRFADISGKWSHTDQFKLANGIDDANLRWGGVDGDGRNDSLTTAEMKITLSAEGSFRGGGHGTLENIVDLNKAIVQAEGAHEVKQQKCEEGCSAPFRNTQEADQHYTSTLHVRYTTENDEVSFLNIYSEISSTAGLPCCSKMTTAAVSIVV